MDVNDEFEIEKFDFLRVSIAKKAQNLLKITPLMVTAFDVNDEVFMFGTNIGVIYGFKRGQRKSLGPFIKNRIVSDSIVSVKLISNEYMVIASHSGVYVIQWTNRKVLYEWKCQINAKVTAIDYYMSTDDERLSVISGDSCGTVRYHDIVAGKESIFCEDNGHEIVQIECITNETILISSCLRTVIVNRIVANDLTQIGKNERKICGKFGAVYAHDSHIIYASRPSFHLIKADITGNVNETFILKKANEPKKHIIFDEFNTIVASQPKLGLLLSFCGDEFIVSWNESNLHVIGSDGRLYIKESNLATIIDVKISKSNDNEMFVLLDSRDLIRIRNARKFNDKCQKTVSIDDSDDNVSIHSTESMLNLGPLNLNNFTFVEDEVKKIFGKFQINVSQRFDKLSSSIVSVLDFNSSHTKSNDLNNTEETKVFLHEPVIQENAEIDINDDQSIPLVTRKKTKRKDDKSFNAKRSDVINDGGLRETLNCDHLNKQRLSNDFSIKFPQTNESCDMNKLHDNNDGQSNDENRLLDILRAFKEANPITETVPDDSESEFTFDFNESHESSHSETQTMSNKSDANFNKSDKNFVKNCEINSKILPKNESIKRESTVSLSWELLISATNAENSERKLVSLSASGYNCDTGMGLIWIIAKSKSKTGYLLYYPGFNELKLSKVSVISVAASVNLSSPLYALSSDGAIYMRDGIDPTKPLGTKWVRVDANYAQNNISCMSLNKNIMWCCDKRGNVLVYRRGIKKWFPVNDDNTPVIEFRKVSVAPNNSEVVWAIDLSGKVYVRQGIYTDCGNGNDDLIMGLNWLIIDDIRAKDITVTDDAVWVINENNDNTIYRRHGINPPKNYIGDHWEMVSGPLLVNDNYEIISASASNGLWILTESGSIWRSHNASKMTINEELDSDWLLI